jgi:membrane fusion protein, multidrug efflux system
MSDNPLEQRELRLRRLKYAGVGALGLAALIVSVRILAYIHTKDSLAAWTNEQAIPTVDVIHADAGSAATTLVLPGNVQAYYEAPIHARVSGYLKQWYQDIGAHVKAGQLLATIDTPELDQQLEQAKADLATAQANQALAKITAARWKNLLAEDAVSAQEADEKSGDLEAKTALMNAAQANVDRLEALESFKRIVAPFDGIVTSRKTDVGALIAAGENNGPELFSVADVSKLRVYVHVPQNYSARINSHDTATLTVPEYPGESFPARLVTSADAISDQSGTVLVELETGNQGGRLKPGDYAEVHFTLAQAGPHMQIPASAVIFRDQGTQVATLGPGDHVVMKDITIARDTGASIEVDSGLSPKDVIINSPPDSLQQGDLVRVSGDSNAQLGAHAG